MLIGVLIARIGEVPVGDPFIDIAGHVVETVRTFARVEAADRHRVALFLEREPALWRVGPRQVELVAPWKDALVCAACRLLPFHLRGQTFSPPPAEGVGPLPGGGEDPAG